MERLWVTEFQSWIADVSNLDSEMKMITIIIFQAIKHIPRLCLPLSLLKLDLLLYFHLEYLLKAFVAWLCLQYIPAKIWLLGGISFIMAEWKGKTTVLPLDLDIVFEWKSRIWVEE